MADKSLVEYAYDVLLNEKEPLAFKTLFDKVLEISGLVFDESETRVKLSKFYTQLSLDGRFVTLTDNFWDLRIRHTFEETHINMEEAYSEDDSEDDYDVEEKKLLNEELGESEEENDENESDDIDFDKPKNTESNEEEF